MCNSGICVLSVIEQNLQIFFVIYFLIQQKQEIKNLTKCLYLLRYRFLRSNYLLVQFAPPLPYRIPPSESVTKDPINMTLKIKGFP